MQVSFTLCLLHPGYQNPEHMEHHVFWYIDVVHVRARLSFFMTPEQQGPEPLTVCCEDCQQRQVGECGDTWCMYKWIEPN